MAGFGSRFYIILHVLLALLISFAQRTQAQPQSRLAFCLNLAQAIQTAVFSEKKKYITNEDDLRKELTSGCAGLRYEVSLKAGGGFRVISEANGEAWGIDEKRELIQLSDNKGGGSAPARAATSSGPSNPSGSSRPTPSSLPGSTKVQGAPTTGPVNPAAPTPFLGKPATAGAAPPLAPVGVTTSVNSTGGQDRDVAPAAVANSRMQQCFAKAAFHTESCTNLFNEIESKCGKDDVPLARLCLELESMIASVDMGECIGNEEEWGKCELRRRQLEKKCSNRLRQSSSECRGLAKFLSSVVPASEANAGRAKTGRSPTQTAVQPEMAAALSRPPPGGSAKLLEPSLRTVLRLRPVMFETKTGRAQEMGFVAEEVELVNSSLISYGQRGQIENVKYSQFAALLTSGIQELYGMCKQDADMQKDLIHRLIVLEQENKELKKDNGELRKLLFNITNDIQALKDSLPGAKK